MGRENSTTAQNATPEAGLVINEKELAHAASLHVSEKEIAMMPRIAVLQVLHSNTISMK